MARRTHASLAAGLLMLLGLDAAVLAQTAPDPDTTRAHLGRFGFNPGLVFSTSFDTNPYREAGQGSDVETYVVPQLDGAMNVGRLRVGLFGAVEMVHFANRIGARNYQYGAHNVWQGGRLMPFVDFTSKHTNANPTGFEVGRKSMRNENDFRTGLRSSLGGHLFASAYYRQTRTGWDADAIYQTSSLREKLNRTDTAVGGTFEVALTALTTVRVSGDSENSTFVYSPIRNGSGYRFAPGITLNGPAAIVGSADVGIRSFTSSTSGVNFQGLVSNIALSRMFPTGTFVAVHFDRDLQFSYDPSLAYFVGRSLDTTIIQSLGASIAVQGFFNHNTLAYNVAAPGTIPVNAVDEYGVAVGRKLGQATRLGLSVEKARAAGNQPWDELRVTAFLTYGFGSFQRLDRPIPFQR